MNRICRGQFSGYRHRQTGHAAIIFVIMAPVLFSLFSMAIDGARIMQNEARLDDALEIASLAVAAENNSNEAGSEGWQRNRDIATAYITDYMQDMTQIAALSISKSECEDIQECLDGIDAGDPRFFQFKVDATTEHKTIFKDDDTFGDSYNVQSDGRSRKYQNHPIDIVFISDFSDTMNDSWSGGTQAKYLDLVDIIEDVTDYVAQYNGLKNLDDSTVAYVGFNSVTQSLESLENVSGYEAGWYTPYWVDEVGTIAHMCQYNQYINDSATDTVSNIFVEKTDCDDKDIWLNEADKLFFDPNGAYFYDLEPTTDFAVFNSEVASFYPDWGTSSYEGLIRGAQIADKGDNPRRLLIILSDGLDNYPDITTSLVNAGMCSTITDTLDSRITSKDYEVTSKIVLIGFDYDISTNQALLNCVGTDNAYQAQNSDEILSIILQLITEEIGHLTEAGI